MRKNIPGDDVKEGDTIILLLGLTGAGKSTFINATVGKDVAKVRHGYDTGLSTVSPFAVTHRSLSDRRVVLVDTPGFDDTKSNDLHSLNLIIEWLKSLEKKKLKLAGIVYLHDISVARIDTSATSTKLLRSLNDNLSDVATNVVLASTKWRLVSADEGQKREGQLRGTYWKDLFAKGAKYDRMQEDTDSAWNIVQLVPLDPRIDPRVIQEELEKFRSGLKTQTGSTGLLSLLKGLLGK